MPETPSDPRRRNRPADDEVDDARIDIESADPAPFHNADGPMSEVAPDPAFEAMIEAGGGVAEGFEQAEAQLVENAERGDPRGLDRLLGDAREPEEPDQGVYGDADEVHTSEGAD